MFRRLTSTGISLLLLMGSNQIGADDTLSNRPDLIHPGARIIGGVQTDIEQVPATVALLSRSRVQLDGDLFQAQFCGGTVIAARWVLTAAHCVADVLGNPASPNSLLVLTGSTDLYNPVNQPIAVQRVIVHPEYHRVELGRDIALLQLEYEALVQPVALNTAPVEIDDEAFIAGWGAVNTPDNGSTQSFPRQLRGAVVYMTPGTSCSDHYPAYAGYIDDTVICAGVPDGGRDSCQGDSGGPLYRVVNNSVSSLAGITSWGISCGVAANPGVYTNVFTYLDWINETLTSTSTQPPAQPVNDSPTLQALSTPSTSNTGLSNSDNSGGDERTGFGGMVFAILLPLIVLQVLRAACRTRRAMRITRAPDS